MDSDKDLLFPAFQKFYSALNSLERFRKENSFFDNISSLDTFFSEFRNVTFVLKKSVKHTTYMPIYEQLLEKHLAPLRWFVDTRNETTKEHPFELVKQVEITAYMPWRSFEIIEKQYTVTDDEPLSSVIDKSKIFLGKIHPVEVFFSARFSFFKQGSDENIFEKIPQGLRCMLDFLEEFYKLLPRESHLTDEIRSRIERNPIMRGRQSIYLVTDYVYYPVQNEFEPVNRWEVTIVPSSLTLPFNGKTIPRCSLVHWRKLWKKLGKTDFERFSAQHVFFEIDLMQKNQDLLPAFMIIFDDDSYEIDAFNANNKTTLYRKINETAQQVLRENVKEVFFEYSLLKIADVPGVLNMTSKDRQKFATEEWLVLLKIDNELNEEEYRFYVPGLKCSGYIRQQFKTGSDKKLDWGKDNMRPIIEAFKKKKAMKDTADKNQSQGETP